MVILFSSQDNGLSFSGIKLRRESRENRILEDSTSTYTTGGQGLRIRSSCGEYMRICGVEEGESPVVV